MNNNKICFHNKNNVNKITMGRQSNPFRLQIRPISSLSIMKSRKGSQFNSKDKQNKRPEECLRQSTPKTKSKQPLKLKIYSTHSNLKLNSSFELQQQRQVQNKQQAESFEKLITEMMSLLKKNFVVAQNHITSCTIKKDNLCSLFKFLLIDRQSNTKQNIAQFSYLNKIMDEFQAISHHAKFREKQAKLKIREQTINSPTLKNSYHQEIRLKSSQLQALMDRKNALLESITHIQHSKTQLEQEYYKREQRLVQTNRIIQKNIHSIATYQKQQIILKQELRRYSLQMQKMKKEFDRVQNFINTQNNQLIILASEQYKTIQTDIYDYASYLQCNQLASSLYYEPLSITCITENLQEEIKHINRTLVQNENIDAKEKGKMMRDFLNQWMNKFKKKEEKTKEMIAFKTKCVKTFIEKMQKWMQNFAFKQEYLVGLKKQFVMDNAKLTQSIRSLYNPQLCQNCSPIIHPLYTRIWQLYQKIQNNYKLGNSFY